MGHACLVSKALHRESKWFTRTKPRTNANYARISFRFLWTAFSSAQIGSMLNRLLASSSYLAHEGATGGRECGHTQFIGITHRNSANNSRATFCISVPSSLIDFDLAMTTYVKKKNFEAYKHFKITQNTKNKILAPQKRNVRSASLRPPICQSRPPFSEHLRGNSLYVVYVVL